MATQWATFRWDGPKVSASLLLPQAGLLFLPLWLFLGQEASSGSRRRSMEKPRPPGQSKREKLAGISLKPDYTLHQRALARFTSSPRHYPIEVWPLRR